MSEQERIDEAISFIKTRYVAKTVDDLKGWSLEVSQKEQDAIRANRWVIAKMTRRETGSARVACWFIGGHPSLWRHRMLSLVNWEAKICIQIVKEVLKEDYDG